MPHIFETLSFETKNKIFIDVTSEIEKVIKSKSVKNGILILSILHTSCSLLIQENADNSVQEDIRNFLEDIAPEKITYIILKDLMICQHISKHS